MPFARPSCVVLTSLLGQACVFSFFESFCGVPPEEGEFSTFVNELTWDLPDVPWTWDYNPPPPPPLGPNSPGALYTRMDPLGAELVRENLGAGSYRIVHMNVNTAGTVPAPMQIRAMSAMAETRVAPVLEPGTSTVTVSVEGKLELRK